MCLIIGKILLKNIRCKKTGKVFAFDQLLSLLFRRRADADRFYIGILQIKPRRDIVDLIDDHNHQVFQRSVRRSNILSLHRSKKQVGKAVHLGLVYMIRRSDIPGGKIHDNRNGLFVLADRCSDKGRRRICFSFKIASNAIPFNFRLNKLCKGPDMFFIARIIKALHTVKKGNCLGAKILKIVMQILRQP